jgi:hypothetical protein
MVRCHFMGYTPLRRVQGYQRRQVPLMTGPTIPEWILLTTAFLPIQQIPG